MTDELLCKIAGLRNVKIDTAYIITTKDTNIAKEICSILIDNNIGFKLVTNFDNIKISY